MEKSTKQNETVEVAQAPQSSSNEIAKFPAQLAPLKGCFSASKKAFIAAFRDPQDGETQFAREMNFAAQAMLANPFLISCASEHPDDLVNAIKNVALTGTTLNPTLRQAYLVPFKKRITLMPSYMGLVDILVNSGMAKKVEAHAVFKGDQFSIELGSDSKIKHVPDPWGSRTPSDLLGCYYYVELSDGTPMFDTLSKAEIDEIKKRSPSVAGGKASPWDTDYIEMAKKTAIRRAFKACPKSGISDSKLKAIDAVFDYDEKAEKAWIKRVENETADTFDEEAEFVEVSQA